MARKATGRPAGRPSELTLKARKVILQRMKQGNYLETAAAAAGVWSDTVRSWVRRGVKEADRRERGLRPRESEEPFLTFAADFKAAEAVAEADAVKALIEAGKQDWRAMEAFLKRRHPRRWSAQVNVIVQEEVSAFWDRLKEGLDDTTFALVVRAMDEGRSSGES